MATEELQARIKKVVSEFLGVLNTRNRDIVARRFGLKSGRRETLESIGSSYSITRERVRQIEESSLKQIREQLSRFRDSIKPFITMVLARLNEGKGIMKESALFEIFSGASKPSPANASLVFILTLDNEIKRHAEDDEFETFWSVSEQRAKEFVDSVAVVKNAFTKAGAPVSESAGLELYKKSGATLKDHTVFASILTISKEIGKNVFGDVGLTEWAEIRPRGVRDKSYLVLKREGKPKHFREITQLINMSAFSSRKANVQTVHNELIKDSRFVLVGRGLYGLSEWGYKAGTVKDVLVDVMRSSSKPMTKEDIVAQVMSHRMVKKNTILLNLQDNKIFTKKEDGRYALHEA